MRYKELFEAPVTDIQVHGDSLDFPGSFGPADRRTIRQNIIQGTYVEKLKKIPFDLNVFVLNKEGLDTYSKEQEYGIQGEVIWGNPTYIREIMGGKVWRKYDATFLEPLKKYVLAKPKDSINMIIGTNHASGGGLMKMSPWILIHRLLHTLDYYKFTIDSDNLVNYPTNNRISWFDVPMMKSIEDPKLENDLEMFMEMAVEYLIRGDIRINEAKIKEKCNRLNIDCNVILDEIKKSITDYKQKIDDMIEQAKGTTRYM